MELFMIKQAPVSGYQQLLFLCEDNKFDNLITLPRIELQY